jgi:hypothetical protein
MAALRSKEYYQQELGRIMAAHQQKSMPNTGLGVVGEYAMLAGQLQGLCEGLLRDSPNWEGGE